MLQIEDALTAYLAGPGPHCLEIGAGANGKAGWLATDLGAGQGAGTTRSIALDARKPFPIPTNSFDFIYSEHMIEHVTFDSGATMFKECFRILRPKGTLR